MTNSLSITIPDDGSATVDYPLRDGTRCSKLVSMSELAAIFQDTSVDLHLPMFPKGIRTYASRGSRLVIGVEYPACIIPQVIHSRTEYHDVPIPASIWLTLLERNGDGSHSILTTNIYALGALGLLSDEIELHPWPFYNHSLIHSSGVCWGSSPGFQVIKNNCSLLNLSSLFSLYWGATSNNDLSPFFNFDLDDTSFSEPLDFLQGEPEYLHSWLYQPENHTTPLSAIRKLLGDTNVQSV